MMIVKFYYESPLLQYKLTTQKQNQRNFVDKKKMKNYQYNH